MYTTSRFDAGVAPEPRVLSAVPPNYLGYPFPSTNYASPWVGCDRQSQQGTAGMMHAESTASNHSAPSWTGEYGLLNLSLAAPQRRTRLGEAQPPSSQRPRDWRAEVSFPVPITMPELMCYEPEWIHSDTMRLTNDRGIRYISLPGAGGTRSRWGCGSSFGFGGATLALSSERGVLGMSLAKHSRAHLQSDAATYPGIQQLVATAARSRVRAA